MYTCSHALLLLLKFSINKGAFGNLLSLIRINRIIHIYRLVSSVLCLMHVLYIHCISVSIMIISSHCHYNNV